MHGSTPQRSHLGLWHITSPSHGSSYPLRRMDYSLACRNAPLWNRGQKMYWPFFLDAMALIIHLNTSPMDRTAPMVIFTTLHGDTGWLVAALFVWGFELDWSIFSWIQSYILLYILCIPCFVCSCLVPLGIYWEKEEKNKTSRSVKKTPVAVVQNTVELESVKVVLNI